MVKITPDSHAYLLKRLSQESRINADMDSLCSDCGFLVSSSLLPTIEYESTLNQTEDLIYFYHPDHLGSSSYLSDVNGLPSQHIEYLPFGEIFAEERDINTNYSTPYKFNSKELDEESGLYYYGARYYSSKTNLFYGVDLKADSFPSWSPFTYCLDNPIKLIDPDGKGPGGPPLIQVNNPTPASVVKAGLIVTKVVAIGVTMALAPEIGVPWAVTDLTGAPVTPSPQAWSPRVSSSLETAINEASQAERMVSNVYSVKNVIPEGNSANHIFSGGVGKLKDTPSNRTLITNMANDSKNYQGLDKYGKSWYAKTLDNGTQVYGYSQNGVIKGAGINSTPIDIKTLQQLE